MWAFAVTVLPSKTGTGNGCPLAFVAVAGVCISRRGRTCGAVVAAAVVVCVHPGQKV